MSLHCRVIQLSDLTAILGYEKKKLEVQIADENERTFHQWNARWRQEALEHYLANGWCFMAEDEGILMGYFLAQPFLFMEGLTQCLWVEHLSYSSLEARDELCDLAYKLSREKHFQRVLFPNMPGVVNSVTTMKAESWQPGVLSVKTTK